MYDRKREKLGLAHAGRTMALCACLLTEEAKASLRISQAIDRELNQFKKETAREFKLLLLGLSRALAGHYKQGLVTRRAGLCIST